MTFSEWPKNLAVTKYLPDMTSFGYSAKPKNYKWPA